MGPVLIISPLFPPLEGGLPDHTDHLATHLTRRHSPVVVLSSPGVHTDRPFTVRPDVTRWRDRGSLLAAVLRAAPIGPILWQYVPHMYGRGGVNLAVPRVMQDLRRLGRRQVVIAHEIAAPFSPWPHRSLYALAHRTMWRRLLSTVHAVGVSTDAWLERLGRPGKDQPRLFLAPSPANLPVVPVAPDHRTAWRHKLGVAPQTPVLGFFGSPGSGKQFEWVLAAWRRVRDQQPGTVLVTVGGKPSVNLAPGELNGFKALGYLGAVEASQALQGMDLLALPFIDGVSERRSSFMAGLAHGLPVVTTFGPATGRGLTEAGCCQGVPVTAGAAAFGEAAGRLAADPEAGMDLGRRARDHYLATYDWPRLTDTLVRYLDPDADSPRP